MDTTTRDLLQYLFLRVARLRILWRDRLLPRYSRGHRQNREWQCEVDILLNDIWSTLVELHHWFIQNAEM